MGGGIREAGTEGMTEQLGEYAQSRNVTAATGSRLLVAFSHMSGHRLEM